MDVFDTLHANGQTIIMVTHEYDIAARSQRVITLVDGKVEAEMSPDYYLTRGLKPGGPHPPPGDKGAMGGTRSGHPDGRRGRGKRHRHRPRAHRPLPPAAYRLRAPRP